MDELRRRLEAIERVRAEAGPDVADPEDPSIYTDDSDDDDYVGRPSLFPEPQQQQTAPRAYLELEAVKAALIKARHRAVVAAHAMLGRHCPAVIVHAVAELAVNAGSVAECLCSCGGDAKLQWGSAAPLALRCSRCGLFREARTSVATVTAGRASFCLNPHFHVKSISATRHTMSRWHNVRGIEVDELLWQGTVEYELELVALARANVAVGCVGSGARLNYHNDWFPGLEQGTCGLISRSPLGVGLACEGLPSQKHAVAFVDGTPLSSLKQGDTLILTLDADQRCLGFVVNNRRIDCTVPLPQGGPPYSIVVGLMYARDTVAISRRKTKKSCTV